MKECLLVDLADKNDLLGVSKVIQDKSDGLPYDINSKYIDSTKV